MEAPLDLLTKPTPHNRRIGKLFPEMVGFPVHEHSSAARCLVESDSTAAVTRTAQAQGRQTSFARSHLSHRNFVLRNGIPWEMLPQELGWVSGMTCWRRLRDWQETGIWQLIHFSLLDWLARYGEIEWSRAVVYGSSIRGVVWGRQTGPNPTDRAKLGSKRHLICDARGVPLAIQLTGAN